MVLSAGECACVGRVEGGTKYHTLENLYDKYAAGFVVLVIPCLFFYPLSPTPLYFPNSKIPHLGTSKHSPSRFSFASAILPLMFSYAHQYQHQMYPVTFISPPSPESQYASPARRVRYSNSCE